MFTLFYIFKKIKERTTHLYTGFEFGDFSLSNLIIIFFYGGNVFIAQFVHFKLWALLLSTGDRHLLFVVGSGGRRVCSSDDFYLFCVSLVVEHVGEESAAGRAGRLSPRGEPGRARRSAEELAVDRSVLPVGKRIDKRVDDTGRPDQDGGHHVNDWHFCLFLWN
jgi:hypothetical protein